MKALRNVINIIVWLLASTYLVIVVLLHIPAVQTFIGSELSAALEEKFGTRFEIGRVNMGFLNRIIIDDVVMYDQHGKAMLQASRLSAKIDYLPLSKGEISVSSAQFFGLKGQFYKKDAHTPSNYQFALDSLASKDTTSHKSTTIHVGSLIIRNGSFCYDRHDVVPTNDKFNAGHIDIRNISTHLMIPYVNDDGVQVQLKKLSLKERTGMELRNMSFKLTIGKKRSSLEDFRLLLPATEIRIDSIGADYEYDGKNIRPGTLRLKGEIKPSKITLSDIACFEPPLKSFTSPVLVKVKLSGRGQTINISDLYINSKDGNIALNGNGTIKDWYKNPEWKAIIGNLSLNGETIRFIAENMKGKDAGVPGMVMRLGNVSFKGDIGGKGKDMTLVGNIHTDIGDADINAGLQDKKFHGHLKTDCFDIHELLADDRFGMVATDVTVDGNMERKGIPAMNVKGKIMRFDYNSYSYNNIEIDGSYDNDLFDGSVSMDDPNGSVNAIGRFNISKAAPSAKLAVSVRHFNPGALKISDKWKDAVFNANLSADISGNTPNNLDGNVCMTGFTMSSEDVSYYLDRIQVVAGYREGVHTISMNSDFGEAEISGIFDFAELPQSLTNLIGSKLPTLPGLPQLTNASNNNFTIHAKIDKTDWLNAILGIPLSLDEPLCLNGGISDKDRQINLELQMPDFGYDNSKYEDARLEVTTNDNAVLIIPDAMQANAHVKKVMDNGHKVDIDVNATAVDNHMDASISWDNQRIHPIKGMFKSSIRFFHDERGKPATHVHINPSEILVNDTVWNVYPSDIVYSGKRLMVDNFTIKHNKQHIIISGLATESLKDSVLVDLQDVDVNYILNLVNFHSVEFSGLASGKACVKSAFKNPEAYSNLTVKQFRFEDGRMGTLTAGVRWNKEDSQIDIDAYTIDGPLSSTIIKGYVSPSRNYIDLGIEARNTRLEFLESFCGSFMENVDADANGKLRLAGDLKAINLTGELVANGQMDISALSTTYWLKNDTVRLIPDEIIFRNDTIHDKYGNVGIVSGMLHHKHLTRLTFDLNVNASNLLAYDCKEYGDNSFYGTVFATGDCAIHGRNGRIDFDINATPGKGSFIEYNAASPDAISNQEFIEWHERQPDATENEASAPTLFNIEKEEEKVADISTDIHINFLINTSPDFTLRVLMDQNSGDCISLNGNGTLRAAYYNKGSFDMFGNYMIDHGTYRLTIQNIIKKEFNFQQGSMIVFGGDPYNAALNLKALYTVNGVPLSDLQIGKSFSSNNVRVDCMMNITGTPHSPRVDFDLDMPTVNADAKQMVRSLINSEEEMNQQVIYLLSIGRFYVQGANNANSENNQHSQTSLAMQSLLSGTLSQQINEVLSTLVNNNNWNFGANISTGDEGWNNAEYEGLLSGKLLNNRLLINGQFGYRDNANATTSFIGDFDIRYLLLPSGNLSVKMYNQTNDRYFTKSSLNTQGFGIVMKKDFNSISDLFGIKNRKKKTGKTSQKK